MEMSTTKDLNGGHPVEALKVIDSCDVDRTGSTVRFKPDEEIFTETTVYNYDTLYKRLQEIAFLNKGLRINLYDLREMPEKHDTFLYNGGIIEYVEMLNKSKTPIHDDIIYMDGAENGIEIEVACQSDSDCKISSGQWQLYGCFESGLP